MPVNLHHGSLTAPCLLIDMSLRIDLTKDYTRSTGPVLTQGPSATSSDHRSYVDYFFSPRSEHDKEHNSPRGSADGS